MILISKLLKWVPMDKRYKLPNYEVSSFGQCRNKETGYIFNPKPKKNGYIIWRFTVKIDGMRKTLNISSHIALAYSFKLPKGKGQIQVDHINRNPSDNAITNLRWATLKEQAKNKVYKNISRYQTNKSVEQYDLNDNLIKVWKSGKEASVALGILLTCISAVCRGRQKTSGGFKWKNPSVPDLPGEIWKEYKHGYLVSSFSRFKSPYGQLLKQVIVDGYKKVSLKDKKFFSHCISCLVFHGSRPSKDHTVDHIDRNPLNDHIDNLRWATHEEQAQNKKNVKPILQFSIKTGKLLGEYTSACAAGRKLGLERTGILSTCHGKNKTCGGFIFKFKE